MIVIRKALPDDAEFIIRHAYRLLEFNLPSWRKDEKERMIQADIRHISKALLLDNADDCVFIAEDSNISIGFIRLVIQTDYYTGERHVHINDIVVTAEAEGHGAGKLLLVKADNWAKEKSARWITLNVFEGNVHARTIYEKAGYKIEWIKYLKQVE